MQIRVRCYSCKTPYVVSPQEVISALDEIHRENHKYYNAFCPRCGKANRLPKKQLRRAAPGWDPTKVPPKAEAPKPRVAPNIS